MRRDQPCRVLIVDDHPVVRSGLRHFLSAYPRFPICGEAGDGREAVRKCAELRPDLVILELSLPVLGGVEATVEILAANPKVEVLVFSKADSERLLTRAFAAGARAYVSKNQGVEALVAALDSLREGVPSIPASLMARLGVTPAKLKGRRKPLDFDVLTLREREIARILAEGKSNKEAAVVLGISVKTAETHRSRIMRKLGLRSFADLVHYAIRNHYLEVNSRF